MSDIEKALDLLNDLGIVGPNIYHREWLPDDKMPEPYDGPGWCVCGRVMPCEAQALGDTMQAIGEQQRDAARADADRLAALVNVGREQACDIDQHFEAHEVRLCSVHSAEWPWGNLWCEWRIAARDALRQHDAFADPEAPTDE